jgi:HD-like signal output (HDOD) protein
MVEVQALREQLVQVFDQLEFDGEGTPLQDMRELERATIGADHCAFGAALCETWKFPKSFSYVTGHHHEPMELPGGSRALASVVHIADRVTAAAGYGFRSDLLSLELDPDILSELRMTDEHVQTVRENLPAMFEEVEGMFR